MNHKDAREVLQEEIKESVLRLRKAKFGNQGLNEIVPEHNDKFYLPDKKNYFPPEKNHGMDLTGSISNFNKTSKKGMVGRSNTNMSRAAQ